MILFKVYVLFGFLSVFKAQSKFMPNLPLGEYRIIITAVYQCKNISDLPISANIYLSKRSTNITEMRGNFTINAPYDDSYILDANIASWSLTGGWKPNSIVYVTNNACSKSKYVFGNAWLTFAKAFNFPTTGCPVPVGVYKSSGWDTTLLNDNNFPKVYFYGKYKFVGKAKAKNNRLVACVTAELIFARPWESPMI